jgi:hypothetical protein
MIRCLALFPLLMLVACPVRAAAPGLEPWCGKDGGELPDLWQQTWLEVEALEEVPKADAWTNAPGRVGTLLNKFALLQRGSVKQGQQTMAHVRKALDGLTGMRTRLIDAANATNAATFTQTVAEARMLLENLQRKYSPDALLTGVSPTNTALLLPGQPTLSVKATAPRLLTNQTVQVDLRLRDATGAGVGSLQLIETHTRRLHAMLIDPSLEDYHHEHPITSGRPGDFTFVFTPRKTGDYLLWLDVTPLATGRNETPTAVIAGAVPSLAPATRGVTQMESTADGWRFQLRLDRKKVTAGLPVNARLRVTDGQGRPCFGLEPVMGAFAHVVGFMDDRHTMIHVHSHGEPPHELSRSGPEVPFRFVAPKAGFLKVFIQTQVNGAILLARFGLPVE